MATYLYDTYTQNIAGKSRKDILSLLVHENHKYNYALLNKQRLTLAEHEGISFVDAIIDSIAEVSFIYVMKITEKECFILVYKNNTITWAGKLLAKEATGILQLHLQSNPEIKLYAYNYQIPQDFTTNEVITLTTNPLNKINIQNYQLQPIHIIKNTLNKKLFTGSLTIIITIIMLAFISGLWINNYHRNQLLIKQQAMAAIDSWHAYRTVINAPRAYTEINEIFTELRFIAQLQNMAIKEFKYDNHLQITLVSFGASITNLETWAANNKYFLEFANQEYTLSKNLDFPQQNKAFTIMNATKILARVLDFAHIFDNDTTVQVDNIAQYGNYEQITLELNFQQQPSAFITSFFAMLKNYPITLESISGDFALDSFTGQIKLNITGD